MKLDDLNSDILEHIISLVDSLSVSHCSQSLTRFPQLHCYSRNTIFSVLRVNRRLHDASLPFVYRILTFDFSTKSLPNDPASLRSPQARIDNFLALDCEHLVFRAVRKVVVRSSPSPSFSPTLNEYKWITFVEVISRIKNLREIVFDCGERFPPTLLDTLHRSHPSSHLRIRNWTRLSADTRCGDPGEEALARSPCLRALHAVVYSGGRPSDFTIPAFIRIISLAPNIDSVALETHPSSLGGVFSVTDEEQEEKIRERRRFDARSAIVKDLKDISWDHLELRTMLQWTEFCNLSRLQTLVVGNLDCDVLRHCTTNFTFNELKHLSFRSSIYSTSLGMLSPEEFESTVMDFLWSLPPLESLTITAGGSRIDLLRLLTRHGRTLRRLSLHDVESAFRKRCSALTLEQVEALRVGAPSLEYLELDIDRTRGGSWEAEFYSLISDFSQLVRIAFFYDIGLHVIEEPLEVRKTYARRYFPADSSFGEDVWRAVQPKGADPRHSRLEELVLHMGEVGGRSAGHWYYGQEWMQYGEAARQTVCVRRSERDDQRATFSTVVTGPGCTLDAFTTLTEELDAAASLTLPSDTSDDGS
ncbi:hypothetical protein PQX77_000284 [Marasmius sp. AFHP31]|nr:hypothetical protein PQX77_000284 [Marasmius sp. AFHP31]